MNEHGFFKPGEYASIPKLLLADTDICPSIKVIYLGLQSYLAGDKTQAWPGPADLGRKTGLSRRTIQNGLEKLVAAGWITKDSKGGPNDTNLYTLFPRCRKCASAQNALPVVHEVCGTSAQIAPKELNRRTQIKNPNRARSPATPTDPRVKTFLDFFCKTYADTAGRPYVVNGGKDGATIKRLLQSLSLEELQQATGNMLADPWGKEKADIGLLASKINSWRGKATHPKVQRSGYTPAKTNGTDYGALTQRF